MGRFPLSLILLASLLAACAPASAITPDTCDAATRPGAREKFTFDQIVPCLNSVAKVSAFTQNNMKVDAEYDTRERGGNEYAPAATVYARGMDDGDGLAILQCYFLENNGFDAFVIGFSIETPLGSNGCGVRNADGTITVLGGLGNIEGPFNSITDLAQFAVSHNWMPAGGSLRTLKASQVIQLTTDETSPSVLELPWVTTEY